MTCSLLGTMDPWQRDAEDSDDAESWDGTGVRLSAAVQQQVAASNRGVHYATWATRVCDPAAGAPARAEHLASLENFLATHDFRGATGRLQRLAVAKRLSRLGAGVALQSNSSASSVPSSTTTLTTKPVATGDDGDDLATEALGQSLSPDPELEPLIPSATGPPPIPTIGAGAACAPQMLTAAPEPEPPKPSAKPVPTDEVEPAAVGPPPIPTIGAGAANVQRRLTMSPRMEPEPEPEPIGVESTTVSLAPIPTIGAGVECAPQRLIAGKRYVCARRAVIRRSFEIDSDKTGTLERDTVVEVLEERQNKQGTIRVHFTQGWVSKTTAAGLVVLEDEKESCDADSRAHAADLVPALFCAPSARKQEPLDGGAVGTQIAIGAVPRYCKKCKLVFSTTACPGGHANFMYTKTLPT